MRIAPDSPPTCAPDSFGDSGIAPDSFGPIPLALGAAADLFCAARAAEVPEVDAETPAWSLSLVLPSSGRNDILSVLIGSPAHERNACGRGATRIQPPPSHDEIVEDILAGGVVLNPGRL